MLVMAVKYFDRDHAKNAKLRAERGIGFEDIIFHIERGDCSTSLNTGVRAKCHACADLIAGGGPVLRPSVYAFALSRRWYKVR
jgi:hypothetical protein